MIIRTTDLTKTFKGFRSPEITAVDHIDLEIDEGTVFGYLGPNGAGKTTTIRMLSTILPPTSGTAQVCGYDIRRQPLKVKERIGLMPENAGFQGNMTGLKVLMYYGEFYDIPKKKRKERALDLLEEMGIGGAAKRKVKDYSHGMRRRLSLCVALFNEPELLILDEPTSGLDPQGTYEFRNRIRSLKNEGITIFLSSHLLTEVEQICDDVGIIHRGKLVERGTIGDLRRKIEEKSAGMTMAAKLEGMTPGISDKFEEEEEGIKAVQKVGEEYFFRIGARKEIPRITKRLVERGVDVYAIEVKHISLEDIFLSLTGDEEKEDEHGNGS